LPTKCKTKLLYFGLRAQSDKLIYMEDILRQLKQLDAEIMAAWEKLNLDALLQEQKEFADKMQQPDFWNDTQAAQATSKKHASITSRTESWVRLKQNVDDLAELAETKDESLEEDITKQLNDLKAQFNQLKAQLKFTGPYDDHDAILSIHAGAGGTDAQDWAGMLMRMYIRWAESHRYDVNVVEESVGEEAGIKSVTLEISGQLLFGRLKSEHGVHRLVRLSPFNADNLRQTSFAKVEVMPKIEQATEVAIDEKDLKIDVYRAGGHGGQSVNTTDSAVRITHIPTGITVAIQNERSQLQNKETALTILRSRLAQLQLEQHQDKISELKGPNQSAEWGNQIRSYVLHPYKMVKDLRTKHETSDPEKVLDGDIDQFIDAYLQNIVSIK
jgi:peptide chain release factor 2